MANLIAAEELIKKAKEKGIDFGKGDPYNRLRYYTKIGWLPHMTRQKDERGNVKGHYPTWVLSRLAYIEQLKDSGYSNDEIEAKINQRDVRRNIFSSLNLLDTPEKRSSSLTYLILVLLFIIFLSEFGVVGNSKTKNELIQLTQNQTLINQIADSGTNTLFSGKKVVFVKSTNVTNNSKVYVTFNENYSPATRYWVPNAIPFEGFYVELDSPTAQNASFTWWITN